MREAGRAMREGKGRSATIMSGELGAGAAPAAGGKTLLGG
jgi:hypothetical protein